MFWLIFPLTKKLLLIILARMKFVKQFCIIIFISLIGELLSFLIPLPIPAGIYGMIILFLCLKTKLIKLSSIKDAGDFFIEIMPIFFVAPGVAILGTIPTLKKYWWQFLIITIVSFLIVFFVTGHATQLIIKISDQIKNKKLGIKK